MLRFIIPLLAALAALSAYADTAAPVPGARNPVVTQDNLASTACLPNWSKTVRPPTAYTNKLKAELMKTNHISGPASAYELDHRLPLICGGAPRDPDNLWLESWTGDRNAHMKDALENHEHNLLCHHKITLAQCQAVFLGDWWPVYDTYIAERSHATGRR